MTSTMAPNVHGVGAHDPKVGQPQFRRPQQQVPDTRAMDFDPQIVSSWIGRRHGGQRFTIAKPDFQNQGGAAAKQLPWIQHGGAGFHSEPLPQFGERPLLGAGHPALAADKAMDTVRQMSTGIGVIGNGHDF